MTHEFGAAGAEFCPLSDQVVEYPRHVIESHYRVAGLVKHLKKVLRGLPINVQIKMIEAASAVGMWKCLRHRIRSQSAILVNGRKICEGDYSLDEAAESIRREALRILG
ncbi:MAG TPA: hypothetical protein EYH45_04445 [Candidatus Caldiarchaeum subterraneum]|uniref:Uncharacterized protein n=1 Tax=Caldiarchaeum subterraneum TaxID=311458 RepID=A0A832ZWL0_CALS0|nr:hypothetical protein [Candidatus Caldarchaeum subterraneum]